MMVLYLLGGMAPPIVVFTLLIKNKVMPAKQLFKTVFSVKQPILMYACIIGFLVLYFCVGALVGLIDYVSPVYLSLLTFPVMLVGGGFEEVGWRYMLQPALEKRFPFVIASSITAVVWALWHIPLFYMEGTSQYNSSFALFAILTFAGAFILAAIYRLSKSVWLCISFHALSNCLYGSFMPRMELFEQGFVPTVLVTAVCVVVSILVVILTKKQQKHAI